MRFLGLIIFIALWSLMTYTGLVDSLFIPTPHNTLVRFIELFGDFEFSKDIFSSIYRIFAGVILSSFIGITFGIILGSNSKIYKSSELLLDFFRSIPATAIFPLALLIFGVGDLAKIGIVTFSCSLIMILQTYYGVSSVSKTRLNFLTLFKANKKQKLERLYIWESLPFIFAGLRVIVSLALILVIVTEMFIGTEFGLGKRLIDAQSTYRISELYAVIFFVGILGYLLNQIIIRIEKKVIHWK